MKAIVRRQFGLPHVLTIESVPRPVPVPGQVLIQVQAFGLNHAELYMRRGSWGDVASISGIECAGNVVEDTTGTLRPGQRVIAAMGGMGRTISGSYAEYVAVAATNVVPIDVALPWGRLALLPESYGVAWSCLNNCLHAQSGERLLVRGANSALGRAAIDLARLLGLRATATTRNRAVTESLHALGAHEVIVGDGELGPTRARQFDLVLDLLGNSTARDSMQLVRAGGHVCLAGFLAGLEPIAQFNPLTDMPSTVQFSFFGSFNFGGDGHAMSGIPYNRLAQALLDGDLRGTAAAVYPFEDIAEAHALMERGEANGKVILVHAN